MAKEQKGFIVYGDIKATADELTDEQLGKLFRGMITYFVDNKTPKFTGSLKFAFIPIKQQMDRDAVKYDKRCEKNRANANKRWQSDAIGCDRIQSDAMDANTNTNKDKNTNTDKDTNTESVPDAGLLSFDLIQYLNEKTGSSYKADKANALRVQSLLDSGYTPLELRTVIDKKCTEWMTDEKMRPYLRPSTLFGDKFGEYLSAPIPLATERKQKQEEDRAELERKLSEKRNTLSDMKEALSGADKSERRHLREQIAVLEDSIGLIEGRLS